MIIEYIQGARRLAKYELMEIGRFFGSITECPGAWGEGETLEACREDLQTVLEDWILIRLQRGLDIPVIDGLDLNPHPGHAQAD